MSAERKLFKFYKSYFDVACELQDKDRLAFYDAIMNRQFLGVEPNLKGIAKLAYVSQKFNIDAQVKGWEDKTKLQLSDNHASIGAIEPPATQLEEKEKVKEKEKDNRDAAKAATLKRMEAFKLSLYPFTDKQGGIYEAELVKEFFEYWSELNKSETKMKWELQATFEISKRLSKWAANDSKFKQPKLYKKTSQIANLTGKEKYEEF